jgi:multimeric flavodoxin WrbA
MINKSLRANRILGIVGSPRKNGNTHILVNRILEGARKNGAETEIIFLGDLHIRECDGCHVCWKSNLCSKKDDMLDVYPKIFQSDVIVFGTPVYWYGPTALMKCLIDRMVYFNCPRNRPKIRGKAAVIAVPFEEDDPKTAGLLVKFFEKSLQYLEVKLIRKILVPGVSKRGDILRKEDLLEKAFNLGIRLAQYQQ